MICDTLLWSVVRVVGVGHVYLLQDVDRAVIAAKVEDIGGQM